MGKVKYDAFKVTIKQRSDNTLVVFVDYYKNDKFVEQKRTTNPQFIEKVLNTATATIKNAKYVGNNLEANYQKDGVIVIENYGEVKKRNEFSSLNKKVSRKLKNDIVKKEEKIKKKKTTEKERKEILKGVKNVRVSRNKKLFKKVALKTKKYLSVATMGIILMSQVMLISRNLENFSLFSKKDNIESMEDVTTDSMLVETNKLFTKSENNEKISINELLQSSQKNNQVNEAKEIEVPVEVENSEITVPATQPVVNNDGNVVVTPQPIDSEIMTNAILIEDSKSNEVLKESGELIIPQVEIQPELNKPTIEDEKQLESNDNISFGASNVITDDNKTPVSEELIIPQVEIQPELNKSVIEEEKQLENNDNISSGASNVITDDNKTPVSEELIIPQVEVQPELNKSVIEEEKQLESNDNISSDVSSAITDDNKTPVSEELIIPQVEVQPELNEPTIEEEKQMSSEETDTTISDSLMTLSEEIENSISQTNNDVNIVLDEQITDDTVIIKDSDDKVEDSNIELSASQITEPEIMSEELLDNSNQILEEKVKEEINENTTVNVQESSTSNDLYTQEELNSQVNETLAKYNLTNEQFDKICAVVQQEAGHNPEEVKNVITTIVNRMESGKWGGTNPWDVVTESGQFEAYGAGHYKKYENNKYDESTAYIVAATLNGDMDPTHDWERFRSNGSIEYGGTILTPGGNRYK